MRKFTQSSNKSLNPVLVPKGHRWLSRPQKAGHSNGLNLKTLHNVCKNHAPHTLMEMHKATPQFDANTPIKCPYTRASCSSILNKNKNQQQTTTTKTEEMSIQYSTDKLDVTLISHSRAGTEVTYSIAYPEILLLKVYIRRQTTRFITGSNEDFCY